MERRYSRQRETIYQAVLASRAHPTAEMIHEQLRGELPQLSLGTVYRNLRLLVEEGRLQELGGSTARFDGVTAPHTHLRCKRCGQVLDLESLPYDPALDRMAAAGGAVIESHSLVFTGLCPECAGKAPE
ncbi:Fur family transcriptional regulator [Dysosmobacter sp.]|uniref:Fur family transcriptional regulator n=1 Tax=Dysosmobacter sp. TaxID=2591382 RepID=UPI003FD7B234